MLWALGKSYLFKRYRNIAGRENQRNSGRWIHGRALTLLSDTSADRKCVSSHLERFSISPRSFSLHTHKLHAYISRLHSSALVRQIYNPLINLINLRNILTSRVDVLAKKEQLAEVFSHVKFTNLKLIPIISVTWFNPYF